MQLMSGLGQSPPFGNHNHYSGNRVSMSFHDLFPATTWLWRKHRSRPARRLVSVIGACVMAVVLVMYCRGILRWLRFASMFQTLRAFR
jgi:hypothetical protein